MEHFRVGVDTRDAAHAVKIARRSLLKHSISIIGVAAIFRLERFSVQLRDDFRKSHFIRLAHSHVDDFGAWVRGEGGTFGPFDLLKLINRSGLAVVPPTDPLSEEALNVSIG